MRLSRRVFLLLTAGLAGGCGTVEEGRAPATRGDRTVNAGSAHNYAADGVYSGFRQQGFFVIRQGNKLFALSAICTHRKCTLAAEPDRSFCCKCHGSTFDAEGHVTGGPANRDLPVLAAYTSGQGELMVDVSGK